MSVTGKTYYTPEGRQIITSVELYDGAGNLVKSDNISRINKNDINLPMWTYINNNLNDNSISYGGTPDPNNPSIIFQDEAAVQKITFNIAIGSTNDRLIDSTKTVYSAQLPVNAKFDPALNPGWTYDSVTNTVTSPPGNNVLYLSFLGQTYQIDIKLTEIAKLFYDKMEPDEVSPIVIDPVIFKLANQEPTGVVLQKTPDKFLTSQASVSNDSSL